MKIENKVSKEEILARLEKSNPEQLKKRLEFGSSGSGGGTPRYPIQFTRSTWCAGWYCYKIQC